MLIQQKEIDKIIETIVDPAGLFYPVQPPFINPRKKNYLKK